MIRNLCLCLLLSAASISAQNWLPAPAFRFSPQAGAREDADYRKGLSELDAHEWEQAIASFKASASHGKQNADAALYWMAYAQNRNGERDEALVTLSGLSTKYPASQWLKDARALQFEVRAASGSLVTLGTQADAHLQVMAVNKLMQSDPGAALPVVEQVLSSNDSDQIKEQALFVLTQNQSPQAGKLLAHIAGGNGNPALQMQAIRLMGMLGNDESRKSLASLYSLSSDARVKQAILQSATLSGSSDLLIHAAKTELNPQLRRDAIQQLAIAGDGAQLWNLYDSTQSRDDRKAILESMALRGEYARLIKIAQSDPNAELRASAIQSMGVVGKPGQSALLVSIFEKDKDAKVRDAVLNALLLEQDGPSLVALARQEKDPQVKQRIVSKMGLVKSREVQSYLLELIK